jgi:hypothetical protein
VVSVETALRRKGLSRVPKNGVTPPRYLGGVGGGGGAGGPSSSIGAGGGGRGGGGGFGGGGGGDSGAGGFGGDNGSSGSGSSGGGGAGLGGAIFNMGDSNAPGTGVLNLLDTTLSGNTAQGGSGGNGGDGYGGALFNLDGSVTVEDAILAANNVAAGAGHGGSAGVSDGGAVYNLADGNNLNTGGDASASLTLFNSILSNSSGGSDLAGQMIAGAHINSASVGGSNNLVMSSDLGNTTLGLGVITATTDPNLGPLQDNGGPTPTLALSSTSSAFGAGNTNVPNLPGTDQRGLPRLNNGRLDLGAFEVQVPTFSKRQLQHPVRHGDAGRGRLPLHRHLQLCRRRHLQRRQRQQHHPDRHQGHADRHLVQPRRRPLRHSPGQQPA